MTTRKRRLSPNGTTRTPPISYAQRKAYDARLNHPQVAAVLLAMYRELYDVEDEARGAGVLDELLSGSTDYAGLRRDVWAQQHPQRIRRAKERRVKADRIQRRRAQRRRTKT